MNIIIIGAGEIGFLLSKRLSTEKHNITLIESDPVKARRAREQLDAIVVEGNGSSYKDLKEASFENNEMFAALSNNDEVNLIACQMAKKAGIETTIARVRNPEYTSRDFILSNMELGADYIIQPEKQTAKAIIRLIRQSEATDIIDLEGGKIQLMGFIMDKSTPVLNTPLKKLSAEFGPPPSTIVAIKRRQVTIIPRGDDMILEGDQVFMICTDVSQEETLRYFGKTFKKVEDVMIIGGGLIGSFIASELAKETRIKIIEHDEAKSQALADKLSNALVIHGEGSDLDLLTFEGLADMDAFIATTGDDETNIITSLVANHMMVRRTITLVSKLDYMSLSPAIGLNSVISKQLITVNTIQKYMRQSKVAFFAELPGVDADVIELIAKHKSKITRKPLMNINFPENAIVGAVYKHNGQIIVPKGDTQIMPGDKVVVFSLPQSIRDVEKLF